MPDYRIYNRKFVKKFKSKKASWLGICLATLLLSIQAQQAFGFYMVPLAPSPPACGGRGLGEGGVWGRSLAFCPHFQAALGNAMMLPFRYNPPLERNVLPNKRVFAPTSPVLSGTDARLLAAKIGGMKQRGSQVSHPYRIKSFNLTKYGGWGREFEGGGRGHLQKSPWPPPSKYLLLLTSPAAPDPPGVRSGRPGRFPGRL